MERRVSYNGLRAYHAVHIRGVAHYVFGQRIGVKAAYGYMTVRTLNRAFFVKSRNVSAILGKKGVKFSFFAFLLGFYGIQRGCFFLGKVFADKDVAYFVRIFYGLMSFAFKIF